MALTTQQNTPLVMVSPNFMIFLGYLAIGDIPKEVGAAVDELTEADIPEEYVYLILGYVPQEIEDAVDNLDEEDIPEEYNFIARMWWGRNRSMEMRQEVIQYLQQALKDSMP